MVFVPSPFTKPMRVTMTESWYAADPNWLAVKAGEILHTTHDVYQLQQVVSPDGNMTQYWAYEAINASGKAGFVRAFYVEEC